MRRRTLSALAVAGSLLAAPAAAHADQALMLTAGNQMVSFDTAGPGKALSTTAIAGIPPEETIRGIDYRPATGQLYGWSVPTPGPGPIRTYTIDPASGAATLVGQTVANIASNVPGGLSFDAASTAPATSTAKTRTPSSDRPTAKRGWETLRSARRRSNRT